jgi:transposase
MEDILDLYAQPYDPLRPVVCFDECPYQLVEEVRQPLPTQPGKPLRYDYEYRRKGSCNLFITFQPALGWRRVQVTDRRTKQDFAHQMKTLVDVHFPQAETVIVVLDNLNTHTLAALYETFDPAEARRIARKLEFHFTPKHASWLNMVEIELSVLSRQSIGGRISSSDRLAQQIDAWQTARNAQSATVNWQFTVHDARERMSSLYSSHLS